MPEHVPSEVVAAALRDPERFSLVRKQGALGWVLRTDHFGVFVEWDDGPGYAHATDLVPVGGAIGTYVSDLLNIIRWLHPDDAVDPRSMAMIRRQLGNGAAVLLNAVVAALCPPDGPDGPETGAGVSGHGGAGAGAVRGAEGVGYDEGGMSA